MKFDSLKEKAHNLFKDASWLTHIQSDEEYELALKFMDELMDDYEYNRSLAEVLSASIIRWENKDVPFKTFDQYTSEIGATVDLLKTLIAQHNLGESDFKVH